MNEWKRIFSDRRRRLAMLCIPLLCLFLFFYQKCGGNFPALITGTREYRELLAEYADSTPAEIVEAFPDPWSITENEQRLLAQAEHLRPCFSALLCLFLMPEEDLIYGSIPKIIQVSRRPGRRSRDLMR